MFNSTIRHLLTLTPEIKAKRLFVFARFDQDKNNVLVKREFKFFGHVQQIFTTCNKIFDCFSFYVFLTTPALRNFIFVFLRVSKTFESPTQNHSDSGQACVDNTQICCKRRSNPIHVADSGVGMATSTTRLPVQLQKRDKERESFSYLFYALVV